LKKYLIILSGSPRGSQYAWKSLIKYVKEPLSADLAVSYGNNFKLPNYLEENSEYIWDFNEPSNWKSYYKKEYSGTWKNFLLLGKDLGMAGGIDNFSGSGAIVSGLKDIIYKNYLSILDKYDYIIHTRFDQMYTETHEHFEGDKIWIPEGEDYYGICDRHAIFPAKYSKEFFGICEYINDTEVLKNPPKHVTPESVLLGNLKYNNLDHLIERCKRKQFTVADSNDTTRWRVAEYKLHFYRDLKMKYPDEFLISLRNRIDNLGIWNSVTREFFLTCNFYYLNLRRNIGNFKRKILS